mmetsp:Transcript_113137/g.320195  ORF Transcript_113137/g.320195 Transcript_113137/m.320195 type:complete len:238 (-) Transcript_113137:32-745(-)
MLRPWSGSARRSSVKAVVGAERRQRTFRHSRHQSKLVVAVVAHPGDGRRPEQLQRVADSVEHAQPMRFAAAAVAVTSSRADVAGDICTKSTCAGGNAQRETEHCSTSPFSCAARNKSVACEAREGARESHSAVWHPAQSHPEGGIVDEHRSLQSKSAPREPVDRADSKRAQAATESARSPTEPIHPANGAGSAARFAGPEAPRQRVVASADGCGRQHCMRGRRVQHAGIKGRADGGA